MAADLYLRLSANTGGAIRQLERVGYTLDRLAGTAEESGRAMRASWTEDRGAASRLANSIRHDAEKQIAAWKLWEDELRKYVAQEGAALTELIALHDAAISRLSQNPGLAKMHSARITQLQEEKAGVQELSSMEGQAAMSSIAMAQMRQKEIRSSTDQNIAKIKEQQVAQEEADRRRAENQAKFKDQLGAGSMSMVMGGAVVLAGTGIIADGMYKASRAAASFDSTALLLVNHANLLPSSLEQVKTDVLALGPAVGIGPEELLKSFYHIQSAGNSLPPLLQTIAGKEEVMAQAAHLSKVGHADLEQTTNALISVLDSYRGTNITAAQAAGILNTTVGEGNMRMADLNSALKTGLLPVAAEAGVKITSLGAALATMTDLGIPASRSATYLRSAIIQMTMPSGPAAKALEAIGLGSTAAKEQLDSFSIVLDKAGINQTVVAEKLRSSGSLSETMDMLQKKLIATGMSSQESAALLTRAFGGIRSGTGVISLVDNLDALKAKERDATEGAANFEDVWNRFNTQDPEQNVAKLHASFQSMEILLGKVLMPTFLHIIHVINGFVDGLLGWIKQNQSLVASLAPMILIGGLLLGAVLLLGGGLGFLILGLTAVGGAMPVILGLMAGGVVVFGILTLAVIEGKKHWGELHNFYQTKLVPILASLGRIFDGLVAAIKPMWEVAFPQLEANARNMISWLTDSHGPLTDFMKGIQDALKAVETWMRSRDFANLIAAIGVYLPKAIGVAIDSMHVWVDTLRVAMSIIVTTVKVSLDLASGNFKQAGKDITDGWKNTADLIAQTTKDGTKLASDETDLFSSETTKKYTDLSDSILFQTHKAMDPAPDVVRQATHAMGNVLEGDMPHIKQKGFTYGKAMVTGMADSVSDRDGKVAAAVQSTIDTATSQTKIDSAYAKASAVGGNLAAGLASGMSAHQYLVDQQASYMVDHAMFVAKNNAGIFSPSRVWHDQIGMQLAAGTAGGIAAGSPLVNLATANLISSAQEAANAGIMAPLNTGVDGYNGKLTTAQRYDFSRAAQNASRNANLAIQQDALYGTPANTPTQADTSAPVVQVLKDILVAIKDSNMLETKQIQGTAQATTSAHADASGLVNALLYALQNESFSQRRRVGSGHFTT